MIKMFTPYAVQIVGEVLRDLALNGVKARLYTRDAFVQVTTGRTDPTIEGCPYCQMGKLLAGAYLYTQRALKSASVAPLYQSLTRIQIAECLWVIEHIPPQEAHSRMEVRLRAIQAQLAKTITVPSALEEVAKDIWNAANIACDLAERVQDVTPKMPPESQIIDGEARPLT